MDQVKIICKCIPGFEGIAIKECNEKLQVIAGSNIRGRVYFDINISEISRVQELRSVSHYWVVVTEQPNYFGAFETNEETFLSLSQLPEQLCWEKALRTWKLFKLHYETKSKNIVNGQTEVNGKHESEEIQKNIDSSDCNCSVDLNDIDPLTAGEKLSFRVTAYRTGKHEFTSMECALHLGSGVNETFSWKVNLTCFDIEVVVYIRNKSLLIGIQLTKDNQSSRNITHFGPTTLKANISYSLLQFAQVSEGDVVCDPMCGSGSISVEGALSCPNTFQIAGENHPIAIEHSSENVEVIEKEKGDTYSLPVSFIRWDVYQLPLRTASVDKIVTDLPFGKRMGNKERNMFLYPVALREMARICRPLGKAALLTSHKGALARAVKNSTLWKQLEVRKVYMGGLDVVVYLLIRTEEEYPASSLINGTPVSDIPVSDPPIHQCVENLSIT